MFFQVGRRCADNHARVEQAPGNQRRIGEPADSHRHVHTLLQQVDAPVVEIEHKLDARVPAAELGDRCAHVACAERQRQGHFERTAQFAVFLRHGRFGFVEVGQDARATLVKAPAGLGQVQAACRTPEELYAEPFLQRRNPPADRGLGNVQTFGGRRKRTGFDDGDKCL